MASPSTNETSFSERERVSRLDAQPDDDSSDALSPTKLLDTAFGAPALLHPSDRRSPAPFTNTPAITRSTGDATAPSPFAYFEFTSTTASSETSSWLPSTSTSWTPNNASISFAAKDTHKLDEALPLHSSVFPEFSDNTKKTRGLDYTRCSVEELKAFAAARSVAVYKGLFATLAPNKDEYVQALQKADQEAHFRFFDLVPELRNCIYRQLLNLDETWTCNPAILATSHQTHQEATGILYGDNTVDLCITLYVDEESHSKIKVEVGNGSSTYDDYRDTEQYLRYDLGNLVSSKSITLWPEYLKRFSNMSISLIILDHAAGATAPSQKDRLAVCNHILYALACFLMDGHSFKSVGIQIKSSVQEVYPQRELWSVLCPLATLGRSIKFTITGVKEDTATSILTSLRREGARTGRTNVVRAYLSLEEEYTHLTKVTSTLRS